MAAPVVPVSVAAKSVVVEGLSFALNGKNVSYRFHVDEATGDIRADHFGGSVTEDPVTIPIEHIDGWTKQANLRREFPDIGRGDFRAPAVHIKHAEGHTVSDFKYKSHTVVSGKPKLPGLPATFGSESDVTTLILHLFDEFSSLEANLSYSIFPKHDAIARSIELKNKGDKAVTIERLSSFSTDFPSEDYDMIELQGDWVRECQRVRRKVEYGSQGFASSYGYSSHAHNPFFALVSPSATESQGEAFGFSLIYTGSFSAEVERNTQGYTRALIGLNPLQLSWALSPGESFTSPEAVSVFSNTGIGAMSRKFHHLYQEHLIKSKFVREPRPVLLNSWEGVYFNFDEKTVYKLAQETAKLGAKLFVLDDGWFGEKYPRVNDHAGLGDWVTNPARFPEGLKPVVENIKKLDVANSSEKLKFGLWVEPEMVNPKSKLYEDHPDWVVHATNHPRTEARNQLVLNLALPEVQDYIIASMSRILEDAPIDYIKWDNNRGIHEAPSPSSNHSYVLGLYRVLDALTTRFPDVLWEGCASGGGRFDPGMLHYFPQSWTSDNTDAHDRIAIQFGTSLVYPPSSMGAHVSAVPNHVTRRTTPVKFRAHVAMMGGSFGLELNPDEMPDADKKEILDLIALADKINPIVIRGDMYRLNLPADSNFPSALFVAEDGSQAALFLFQIRANTAHNFPRVRLHGLDPAASYKVDGERTLSGATLMNGGFVHKFGGDYDSRIVFLEKV